MKNQEQLINEKAMREEFVDRTDVLDKVGELLLLPNTEFGTTEQVAKYYRVTNEVIRQLKVRNEEELSSDGVKHNKHREIKILVNSDNMSQLKIPPTGTLLFPKRAILRVGMLLRDSEIAKEIRTRLLDIVQDASNGKTEIIETIVNEISEERQLILDRVEAEMNGDYDEVRIVTAKLFALKNKRIKELEDENKAITTNSLTILESRSVINRLVRIIATKKYNGAFGKAWKELYAKVNYKLGININARVKKPLDSMSDNEMYETEKIVRCWSNEIGVDINKELKLGK